MATALFATRPGLRPTFQELRLTWFVCTVASAPVIPYLIVALLCLGIVWWAIQFSRKEAFNVSNPAQPAVQPKV